MYLPIPVKHYEHRHAYYVLIDKHNKELHHKELGRSSVVLVSERGHKAVELEQEVIVHYEEEEVDSEQEDIYWGSLSRENYELVDREHVSGEQDDVHHSHHHSIDYHVDVEGSLTLALRDLQVELVLVNIEDDEVKQTDEHVDEEKANEEQSDSHVLLFQVANVAGCQLVGELDSVTEEQVQTVDFDDHYVDGHALELNRKELNRFQDRQDLGTDELQREDGYQTDEQAV